MSGQEPRVEAWSQKLKRRPQRRGAYWLVQPAFYPIPLAAEGGGEEDTDDEPSGLDPPVPITNQENILQPYIKAIELRQFPY